MALRAAPSHHANQLRGWLSYAFASEVFVIVSLTLFLPICLEQFASDNGFLLPDRVERCSRHPVQSVAPGEQARCVVWIWWTWIDTASFSLYTYSISVALQALTVISMGGIADNPVRRKPLLLTFALFGATCATLFLLLPSSSPIWWSSALLAISANVGFGASVVAMNAYLPALARESPEVVAVREELDALREDMDDTLNSVGDDPHESGEQSALLETSQPVETTSKLLALTTCYELLLSQTTARISSQGIALGYGAGIILLLLTLIPVTLLHGSTWSLRLAIGLSGIWWALGCIPVLIWLPGGGADPSGVGEEENARKSSTWVEIKNAWKKLARMLRWSEIKKLRNTFRYLSAWFLLSDGFTTITSTALLFGKTTLHMSPSSLILIGILTPLAGIVGSLLWPRLQRKYGWSNLRVLVGLVVGASAIPAYGCLGFLPVLKKAGVGGLRSEGEMFVLAVYFGSVYGAFQSYARAFYTELVPPGEEARWFGLFSITDKSSSFLGPLLVGLIADLTGNIRYAFFFLFIMVWCAVPILFGVDVMEGRRDARVVGEENMRARGRDWA